MLRQHWLHAADDIDELAAPWKLLSFTGKVASEFERESQRVALAPHLHHLEKFLANEANPPFIVANRLTLAGVRT